MWASSSTTSRCFFISDFRFRIFRERHAEREVAPAAGARLVEDLAAVFVSEFLRESETEATALDAAAERVVRAIKGLKDLALVPGRNAHTAIEHAHAGVARIDIAVQFHLLALAGVF